jgi:putative ABC transport system permease protein
MNSLMQDVRHALRLLRAQKTFTLVVLATLTVGIGANTAIFSLLNGLLLRPLPYAQPDRLYLLFDSMVRDPSRTVHLTALDFLDWQQQNRTFDGMAAYTGTGHTFAGAGAGAEPEIVPGQFVSTELFSVLGVPPLLGRAFRTDENEAGHHRVIVLGYGLWQRRFGGDPGVIDRTVVVNDASYTIVGVMPPGFAWPDGRAQAWTPLVLHGVPPADAPPLNRAAHYLNVVGRMKPDVSFQQARDDLSRIAQGIAGQNDRNPSLGAKVIPLIDAVVGSLRPALFMLAAAVGCVLLIACANVTHLQLAQIHGRERELAIRLALGASRGRIVRQILTETCLLALAGGAGGVLLASWLLQLAMVWGAKRLPLMDRVAIDVPVVLFTITVAAISSLLFGLLPAAQIARSQIPERLVAATRGVTAGRRGQLLRGSLIVGEIALSLMLLVGAGLLLRSFVKLQQVDPGFDPSRRVAVSLAMPPNRYPDAAHMLTFVRDVVEHLQAQPGIEAVGVTTALPMTGQDFADAFTAEGYTPPRPGATPMASVRGVTPDFFRALGLRVLRGRAFSTRDSQDAEPVVLVNEAFARRYWPGLDAVGKHLQQSNNGTGPLRTVVGLIADVRHGGAALEAAPEVYVPYEQVHPGMLAVWFRGVSVVVRTSLDLKTVGSRVHTELAAIDPAMPVAEILSMDTIVSDSLTQPRLQTWLVGLFGATALLLASVGIFGVISFLVSQRTREIGIRIALGAQPADVLRGVLGRALGLTLAGVALGLPGAWALSRWMQTMLFEISPTDTLTMVCVPLLLASVATLAAFAPARRASRVDPMVAWRSE